MNSLELHSIEHKKAKKFQGYSIVKKRTRIAEIISEHSCDTVLDFGCGKGMQYLEHRIHEIWNVPLPYCYDPCIPALGKLPAHRFDIVLCVDVMEHVDEGAVDSVLETILQKADKVVYFNISTRPAIKSLSDGSNAHVTVRSKKWWIEKINRLASYSCSATVIIDFTEE